VYWLRQLTDTLFGVEVMISRQFLTKLHLLLAAFMFPAALMFLVTGGLYTWEFKGSYNSQNYEIALDSPLVAEVAPLRGLVVEQLEQLSIELPSGKPKIKKGGTSFKLEWTGAARDVVLEPTPEALVAKLTVKETTWYRNLVQLHKAKGGQIFKVYAAMLAVSLFTILASGFLMAWQVPKLKSLALTCALSGLLLFSIAVFFS